MSKFFLSPILLNFHVANLYDIRISNFEFHQIWRRKNFWHRRVPLLDFSEAKIRAKGSGGHTSRCQVTIENGLNLTFHVVIKVASRPKFLAMLTGKQSTVPPLTPLEFFSAILPLQTLSRGVGEK